jgi:purine-cytosine permease-like protein
VAGTILGGPGRLGRLDASVARWTTHHGTFVVVALVVIEALIGLAALHRRSRGVAVAAGFVLALAIWVVAQDIGQLYTGQATDPNSGLIIAVFAIAVLGSSRAQASETGSRRDGRAFR